MSTSDIQISSGTSTTLSATAKEIHSASTVVPGALGNIRTRLAQQHRRPNENSTPTIGHVVIPSTFGVSPGRLCCGQGVLWEGTLSTATRLPTSSMVMQWDKYKT